MSKSSSPLPGFFVVGAQKAGTTALHNYLAEHPDLYLPEQKETKFFVDDTRYARGIDYYLSEFFSGWGGESVVGEVDPDCLYFETAAGRMAMDLGDVRLIFVFRNPVERAFSHYLMTYRRGLEDLSFEEAIEAEEDRIRRGYFERMHYSYRSRGLYSEQVERFLAHFPRKYMLFLLSDDLASDTEGVMARCFEFIGVDASFRSPVFDQRFHRATSPELVPRSVRLYRALRYQSRAREVARRFVPRRWRASIREVVTTLNRRGAKPVSLRVETRAALVRFYQRDVRDLARLIGRDLSGWL